MGFGIIRFAAIGGLIAIASRGQESICELFKNLQAVDGSQLIVSGELIISKNLAALGAADCDSEYSTPIGSSGIRVFQVWPTAVHLRPSAAVPQVRIQRFQEAAAEADRLRAEGKIVAATATFAGRLRVAESSGFPAELTFDSFEDLKVEALPDPSTLPVIPICELFQNLPAWRGKRIAVRGESVGTSEGSWIVGRCKGQFYTNGYRWPVMLSYGAPAYYSARTAPFVKPREPSSPGKGADLYVGRYNVIRTATYVGRLRMRDQYQALCRGRDYLTNGFGHLNGSAGELIVEAVRDIEISPRLTSEDAGSGEEQTCKIPNTAAVCASTDSLSQAAGLGCTERVRELLGKKGIDSQNGDESEALDDAIRAGQEVIVQMLIAAGAPVNPTKMRLWPPLWEAAHYRRIGMMKLLLQAGAKVDARDHTGGTYLSNYGVFNTRVLRNLLEAGANPNAVDHQGETALMKASSYGYEESIRLLIQHGADLNIRDVKGRSALMYAASGRYVDAIPLLLEHGADCYARDAEGKTALDLARKAHNEVAVSLIAAAIRRR